MTVGRSARPVCPARRGCPPCDQAAGPGARPARPLRPRAQILDQRIQCLAPGGRKAGRLYLLIDFAARLRQGRGQLIPLICKRRALLGQRIACRGKVRRFLARFVAGQGQAAHILKGIVSFQQKRGDTVLKGRDARLRGIQLICLAVPRGGEAGNDALLFGQLQIPVRQGRFQLVKFIVQRRAALPFQT